MQPEELVDNALGMARERKEIHITINRARRVSGAAMARAD
jgi:hypothetical protein